MVIQGQNTSFGPDSTLELDAGLVEITSAVRSPTEIHAQIQLEDAAVGPVAVTVRTPLPGGGEEVVSAILQADPNLAGTMPVMIMSPLPDEEVTSALVEVTGATDPFAYVAARYLANELVVSHDSAFADVGGTFVLYLTPPVSTIPGGGGAAASGAGPIGPLMAASGGSRISVSTFSGPSVVSGGPVFGFPPTCSPLPGQNVTSVSVQAPGSGECDCPQLPAKAANNKFNWMPCCDPQPTHMTLCLGQELEITIRGIPYPGKATCPPGEWVCCDGAPLPAGQPPFGACFIPDPLDQAEVDVTRFQVDPQNPGVLRVTLLAKEYDDGVVEFCAWYKVVCTCVCPEDEGCCPVVQQRFRLTIYLVALTNMDFELEPQDGETQLTSDNPNPGGGWRWYPGAYAFNGAVHDRLWVRARTVWGEGGLAGEKADLSECPCFFEWYDVDDPYDTGGEIDPETSSADNRGGPPTGDEAELLNYDSCLGVSLEPIDVEVNPDLLPGEAAVTFRAIANHQPGDNFRVAASLVVDSLLNVVPVQADTSGRLHYQDDSGQWQFVDDDWAIDKFKSTKMNTVWRYLHVEGDWMGGPPEGWVFLPDDVPPPVNPADPGPQNPGDPAPRLPDPDLGHFTTELLKAYVTVQRDTGHDNEVDWEHNVQDTDVATKAGRTAGESSSYWVAYICVGYEGDAFMDLDPNSESDLRTGVTDPAEPEVSWIFVETIRDWIHDACPQGLQELQWRQWNITHELGHQFGLEDGDLGIMGIRPRVKCQNDWVPPEFLPDHLATIRSTTSP